MSCCRANYLSHSLSTTLTARSSASGGGGDGVDDDDDVTDAKCVNDVSQPR